MTNPSYEDIIEGSSSTRDHNNPINTQETVITTPSTNATNHHDQYASVNPDDYSEPEFPLSRGAVTGDTNLGANLNTYAEGFEGQRPSAPPSEEYADVDASVFKSEGKPASERCDDGEYSVLQNPTRGASGSSDYDLLNHQKSPDVVIVRSDDHEYGQLSRD